VAGTSARERAADSYVVRSPRAAASQLTDSSAVLFGPEDHGLSNEELTRCQLQIVIPTADFSSLNLAQVVLVVAYEASLASRDRASRDPVGEELPTRDQVAQLCAQLEQTMLLVGYTDPPRAPGILRLYRAVLDRGRLSPHELAALRGLASQIDWAARQPPDKLP